MCCDGSCPTHRSAEPGLFARLRLPLTPDPDLTPRGGTFPAYAVGVLTRTTRGERELLETALDPTDVEVETCDADGDGVPDVDDVCPGFDDTLDADDDGTPDGCDPCPFDPDDDADADGLCADVDLCPGTVLPDRAATRGLNPNHYADVDGDLTFEVGGTGRDRTPVDSDVTLDDTGACTCAPIIDALGIGRGHEYWGCAPGIMDRWLEDVAAAP